MNIYLNIMDEQGVIWQENKGSIPSGSTYRTMKGRLETMAAQLFGSNWELKGNANCLIPFYVAGKSECEKASLTIE